MKSPLPIFTLVFLLIVAELPTTLSAQINWGDPINVAPGSFGSNRPRICTNANNIPVIIWGGSGNLWMSRYTGSEFTEPAQLNPDGTTIAEAYWMGPDIASHGDTLFVVYKETPEGDPDSHIWCRRSVDGGQNFEAPVKVENTGTDKSRFPVVTTDQDGHPVVGFMRFNDSFGEARWVVSRSNDHGLSFEPDILASGWSDPDSEVCDCCPGAISTEGNTIAMMYRDNNSNIRDSWAGLSYDNGDSFSAGMNIDQQNWMIMSCPSTGPDGFLHNDTLHAVFMNAASGTSRVFYNASNANTAEGSPGILLTDDIDNLALQNFPRIDQAGQMAAIVWTQVVAGKSELAFNFTENISVGLDANYDLLSLNNVDNADLSLTQDQVYVVWQTNSGGLKFLKGDISSTSSIEEGGAGFDLLIAPNPTSNRLNIQSNTPITSGTISLFDARGNLVFIREIQDELSLNAEIDLSQLPPGLFYLDFKTDLGRLVKKVVKVNH
ncbi:MAG: T9SS type A sorting domain-containing protein [Bacteroidetes bacterium]|nr:T9SS type A sorting domain-containing protein [Bacteroidota bacterium]